MRSIILSCICILGGMAEEAKPAAVKPYPLDHCLLMDGGKVDKDSATEVYQGQEFRFCCKGCVRRFKKDPDKYLKQLAEEVAKKKDATPAQAEAASSCRRIRMASRTSSSWRSSSRICRTSPP